MGVQHTRNLPAVLACEIQIHLWIKRGVNHGSCLAIANEVGEAAFSGAPHLYDTGSALWHRHLGSIPGQTPRLHPPLKGEGRNAPRSKLLGCKLTSPTSSTNRYHGRTIGHIYCI